MRALSLFTMRFFKEKTSPLTNNYNSIINEN